jgi:hypothetical protein
METKRERKRRFEAMRKNLKKELEELEEFREEIEKWKSEIGKPEEGSRRFSKSFSISLFSREISVDISISVRIGSLRD